MATKPITSHRPHTSEVCRPCFEVGPDCSTCISPLCILGNSANEKLSFTAATIHRITCRLYYTIFTWNLASLSCQFQEQLLVLISFATHPQTTLNQNVQRTSAGASSSVKSTELKAGAEGAEPLSSYLTSMFHASPQSI